MVNKLHNLREEYIDYVEKFEEGMKSGKITKSEMEGFFFEQMSPSIKERVFKLSYSNFLLEKILLSLEK